jgi:hypothetical protein
MQSVFLKNALLFPEFEIRNTKLAVILSILTRILRVTAKITGKLAIDSIGFTSR